MAFLKSRCGCIVVLILSFECGVRITEKKYISIEGSFMDGEGEIVIFLYFLLYKS